MLAFFNLKRKKKKFQIAFRIILFVFTLFTLFTIVMKMNESVYDRLSLSIVSNLH